MAKGNFAFNVSVLLGMILLAGRVEARTSPFIEDCLLLGELVRQSAVREIVAHLDQSAYPDPLEMDLEALQSCSATTSVVSSAFAAAFGQFGMQIRWSYLSPNPGGACPGHDLSRCKPFADPMGPPVTVSNLALIGRSWKRLRAGVTSHMPWGTSSDTSYFRGLAITQPRSDRVPPAVVVSAHRQLRRAMRTTAESS